LEHLLVRPVLWLRLARLLVLVWLVQRLWLIVRLLIVRLRLVVSFCFLSFE
jgi:hypothetical protein